LPHFLITIQDDSGFVSIVEDAHKIARHTANKEVKDCQATFCARNMMREAK
jgi:hypothetical protein